jgi:hypothetical protein
MIGALSVDNSGTTPCVGRGTVGPGCAARCCSTKCALLPKAGAPSMAGKSAVFRLRQARGARAPRSDSFGPARLAKDGSVRGVGTERADPTQVRQPGACALWRGEQRSRRDPRGFSCAPEIHGCGLCESSRLGTFVSWLGLQFRKYGKPAITARKLSMVNDLPLKPWGLEGMTRPTRLWIRATYVAPSATLRPAPKELVHNER